MSSSCPYQPELQSGHATSCQKSTINFCPFSHLFQCLSCLGGAQTAYCMTCLKIQMDFASLSRYNIILTGLFMNDSLAWWIAYEVLSRVSQCFSFRTGFVSHSLSWCTAAYQVRSANKFFSCLASGKFADCMTCFAIQRILFPFEQLIAFSPVHICLSLNKFEYVSSLCFIHLQSFHPSVLPYTQQSNHGLPTKMVSSTILVCKSNLSSHLFVSTHSCLFHSSPQNLHYLI